jgi:hypothetical protein
VRERERERVCVQSGMKTGVGESERRRRAKERSDHTASGYRNPRMATLSSVCKMQKEMERARVREKERACERTLRLQLVSFERSKSDAGGNEAEEGHAMRGMGLGKKIVGVITRGLISPKKLTLDARGH